MIIDAHGHLEPKTAKNCKAFNALQIHAMDKLNIDMCAISVLTPNKRPAPDEFIEANNDCLFYMKEYKGRILGYCFVNAGYAKQAVAEVQRCFDEGMIGVKLYHAYFMDDPALYPVVEKTIDLGIPILMHAGFSYHEKLRNRQPNLSGPENFLNLSKVYPEALLIEGHIGGGGDWEYVIEGLKLDSRIYADTSGSVVDESLFDTAVSELGADRLLYANDCSFCDGMGKIKSADLPDKDREKILSGNFLKIMRKRKGGSIL